MRVTFPQGHLVLAMYRLGREGTLHIWTHGEPWTARIDGVADVLFVVKPKPLHATFAFRSGDRANVPEVDIPRKDYARHIGGLVDNHVRRDTFGGGVFVSTGIPEVVGEGPNRIWACGKVTEELWHFDSDAILRTELLNGILHRIGVPSGSIAGLARTVVEHIGIGRAVREHRRLFSLKYQHPENAVDIGWDTLQRAQVKGRTYRIGDQQIGICANSRPTDRFQFVGSVVVSTLPQSKQREVAQSPLRGHHALPVFANLSEMSRGGVKTFSWFEPEPRPS